MGGACDRARGTEVLGHRAIDQAQHVFVELKRPLTDPCVLHDKLCAAIRPHRLSHWLAEDGLVHGVEARRDRAHMPRAIHAQEGHGVGALLDHLQDVPQVREMEMLVRICLHKHCEGRKVVVPGHQVRQVAQALVSTRPTLRVAARPHGDGAEAAVHGLGEARLLPALLVETQRRSRRCDGQEVGLDPFQRLPAVDDYKLQGHHAPHPAEQGGEGTLSLLEGAHGALVALHSLSEGPCLGVPEQLP
mmetsp:Transcript_54531/g.119304  ORF Transcript_54531/g.119304 Transcript_54531/m.119304 type:complete len:246 (-) Transcript_54531:478-1215(-)